MPGRVLGVMSSSSSSSSSSSKSRGDVLEMYGLGGTWFDCRDVEGFLGLMGVDVTNGGMYLKCSGSGSGDAVGEYVLDVEEFFSSKWLPSLMVPVGVWVIC